MKLRKMNLFLAGLCSFFILLSAFGLKAQTEIESPVHQLRIYEIPKENRKVFNERFKDHAIRIMKKYGFKIVAIWESESDQKLEFVYLLQWKNQPAMQEGWKNFMADEEWKEIKKKSGAKYGTFVNAIQEKTLILTDFSPQRDFTEK